MTLDRILSGFKQKLNYSSLPVSLFQLEINWFKSFREQGFLSAIGIRSGQLSLCRSLFIVLEKSINIGYPPIIV